MYSSSTTLPTIDIIGSVDSAQVVRVQSGVAHPPNKDEVGANFYNLGTTFNSTAQIQIAICRYRLPPADTDCHLQIQIAICRYGLQSTNTEGIVGLSDNGVSSSERANSLEGGVSRSEERVGLSSERIGLSDDSVNSSKERAGPLEDGVVRSGERAGL
jgi:hypothetical protein